MSKGSLGQTAYSVFPIANYKFGSKAPRLGKDGTAGGGGGVHTQDKLARLRAK
jgi:hypothetical protein